MNTQGPWYVMWTTGAIEDPELIEAAKLKGIMLPEPIERLTNAGERVVMAMDGEVRVATVTAQADFKRGKGHESVCPERDANARLVAAAPELLEAAKNAAAKMADVPNNDLEETRRQLIVAIEKATA